MMEFGLGSYSFGLLAGVLSTLSPCVLPIVPILFASANSAHPRGSLFLAVGLALSYAVIGTIIASVGTSMGFGTYIFRYIGAVILGLFGLVLMSSSLQSRFSSATSGLGDAGHNQLLRMSLDGVWGQFVIGVVLGVVWSPCVGPTLGATIVLASQGSHLLQVALLMGVFGLGAALPIIIVGHLSREVMAKVGGKLINAGKFGKIILGLVMILLALMILLGMDKPIEVWMVDHSPDWLTELTTHF